VIDNKVPSKTNKS